MRRLPLAAFLLLFAAAQVAAASPAAAATDDGSAGVLKRIGERGRVVIGYSEADFPFSFLSDGHPAGYTIDLCRGVVEDLSSRLGRHLRVDYVALAPDARLAAVRKGRVDLECSTTAANPDRHRVAAFSPIIFLSGTRLLVRHGSTIRNNRDLDAKMRVVVIAGTADEQVIRRLAERGRMAANIVTTSDRFKALAMVWSKHADAMAGEDVLLQGLIARASAGAQFAVVGGLLSHEPYGIMFEKDDPGLADVVGQAFARMAQAGDLTASYDRWFDHRTPAGPAMHLPMDILLTEMFHLLQTE